MGHVPSDLQCRAPGFPVNAGYDAFTAIPPTPELDLLNRLKDELPRVWDGEPFDAITFRTALEFVKARKPRGLYVSLGETDEWAHAGHYAAYLDAAHRADTYISMLWNLLQSMPEYRGSTTLIFSPDHGRGEAPVQWKDHGEKVPDASTSGWRSSVPTHEPLASGRTPKP